MDVPLQQTRSWEKLQRDLGEETFYRQESDYLFLAIKKKTKFGVYLYLPYGPCAETEKSAQEAWKAISELAKREGAIFVRVEPQAREMVAFWANLPHSKKTKDLNPAETWVLDLTQDQATILTNFSQGTRTRYNQYKKKGLSVTTTHNPDDIHYLVELQHKLAREKGIGTFSSDYLKTELTQDFATLYLVHYDPAQANNPPADINSGDRVIAASLFFDDKETRYYMQSAADMDYRKLPATVALLTSAIFDAKEAGKKRFDFWGIAPDGAPADHPWAGFTAFKKSFGGYERSYCGTYDVILNTKKYHLYELARKTNRSLRKIFRK